MSQIIGNTGNVFPEFLLADKFGMESAQVPDYTNDIIKTLMICNKYYGHIFRNGIPILNGIGCSQNPRTQRQAEIEVIDTFFMSLVTKSIQANPLDRMKNNKAQTKAQIINYRNGK